MLSTLGVNINVPAWQNISNIDEVVIAIQYLFMLLKFCKKKNEWINK